MYVRKEMLFFIFFSVAVLVVKVSLSPNPFIHPSILPIG
jgi:hypothetical protein